MNEKDTEKKNPSTAPDQIQTGKILTGTVVGASMQDTAKVAVTRYVTHPKYKKFVKRVKRYLVHDPGNTAAVGDTVYITECKPISKHKTFKLVDASESRRNV